MATVASPTLSERLNEIVVVADVRVDSRDLGSQAL